MKIRSINRSHVASTASDGMACGVMVIFRNGHLVTAANSPKNLDSDVGLLFSEQS